jgi:hypothetical protein
MSRDAFLHMYYVTIRSVRLQNNNNDSVMLNILLKFHSLMEKEYFEKKKRKPVNDHELLT